MKRVTKVLCLFVMTILILGASLLSTDREVSAAGTSIFTDIKNHWAEATINTMVGQGILDGFPDRSFRPKDPIKVDQFIKMLILSYSDQHPNTGRTWQKSFLASLSEDNQTILKQDYRHYDFKPATTGYWAKPYIDIASDLHFLNKNRYADFQSDMTRENVAEVVYYVLQETEFLEDTAFSTSLAQAYGDITSASDREQRFIAEALVKGIMEGYPDAKFGVGNYVTRAEALVILNRLTDKSQRIPVKPSAQSLQRYVPASGGGQKIVEFPDQRMWDAYDMLLQAGQTRGTNFDNVETTVRLYKDNTEKTAVANGKGEPEVSLWVDPAYNTYGFTVYLREGTLARNKEAIEAFGNQIFGYNAIAFHRWFNSVCAEVEAGRPLASKKITLGTDTINVLVNSTEKSVIFSVAATK